MPLGKGQLKLRRRSFGSAFFACHEVLREAGIPKRIEAPYCPYEGAALCQGSVCFLGWQLGGSLKAARTSRKGRLNEGGYMRFEEALLLAGKGQLITRPGYGVSFAAIREGQAVYGHFIGETGFTDVRAYVFTDEDKSATDWELFIRVLPDAWEGCDVPNG